MIDKPKDNVPSDTIDGGEDDAPPQETAYQPRRPRNMVVLFGIVLVFLVLILSGIVVALRATPENPEAIVFPAHISKSLADEQPVDTGQTPLGVDQGVDQNEEVLEETIAPDHQSETTIELNGDIRQQTPDISDDMKESETEEEIAPQSMWQLPSPVPSSKTVAQQATGTPVRSNAPKIAIVIDDMGLNHRHSLAVTQLPATLTLAYLPYAERLPQQTQAAYQKGHELIVHMPMQPGNLASNNPGPDALLVGNTVEENIQRLERNLSKFSGYVGLNNHMGSELTTNEAMMRPLLAEVKKKNLWFLDSKTAGNSVAGKIAGELNIPYAVRDVFLDNEQSVPAILAQLKQTEAIARKRGYAIAIGHPHAATIAALREWLPQAERNGFELVSLASVIAARFPDASVPRYAQMPSKSVTKIAKSTATQDDHGLNGIEPVAGGMSQTVFGIYPNDGHGIQ